jgi:hypothetical protein
VQDFFFIPDVLKAVVLISSAALVTNVIPTIDFENPAVKCKVFKK